MPRISIDQPASESDATSSCPSDGHRAWERIGPCHCRQEPEGRPAFPRRMRELSQWFFDVLRWWAR